MKRYRNYPKFILFSAIIFAAALATVLAQADDILAHGYGTLTPTATEFATATPTATPGSTLQACRVSNINFFKDSYTAGETIRVRVSLVDGNDLPLVGANVDADVVRQVVSIQSTQPGLGLEDRTGDYDGAYSQTQNPGTYQFTFTATDPTGLRFLPCSAVAQIPVTAPSTVTPTVTPT
ncbi:MAG: hypothetical protein D6768_19455, partial [Chloroflexi bacterium]